TELAEVRRWRSNASITLTPLKNQDVHSGDNQTGTKKNG
ncbi:Unannotated, partial [Lentimonas sp. CC6]